MHKCLYLFDGSNCSFRAHCAFKELRLEEFPIGALYGTVRILTNFVKEFPVGKIISAYDVSKSSWRLALYPDYKAGREKTYEKQLKEDYFLQLQMVYDILHQLGICTITEESRGIEADDVISYICSKYKKGEFSKEYEVALIISSDKDLCALVSNDPVCNWYDPISKKLITASNFEETFGVTIDQYPDFKALKGDASDNIPHPAGIGPGTAVKLLKEYGSIEKMIALKHAKIEPFKDILDLGKALITLDLHDQIPKHSVWAKIDQKIREPMVLAPELETNLLGLSFHSILEEWGGLEPRLKEFAACSL
jgi:DNA polymerase-1